jgi:DNA-directed RNA polymerase subunit RPC12/RpoP
MSLMEDTIEVCSKCGKMPRAIEQESGLFACSRCGNNELVSLKTDEYERVVTELDRNYQEHVSKKRIETVAKEMPISNPGKAKKTKSTSKKTTSKKPKAKKTGKKKK